MTRQKKLIVALIVVLVAVAVVGGTLAYFTDTDTETNTFTMGDLDIDLKEDWDPDDGEDMVPGDTVVKKPVVEAVKGDSYMRVIVTVIDKNEGVAANTKVTNATRLAKIMQTLYYDPQNSITVGQGYTLAQVAALSGVVNQYNTTAFDLHSSGGGVYVYWYKGNNPPLTGETVYKFKLGTQVTLFSKVVIPSEWNQDDLAILGTYDIVIRAEAIQYSGFATPAAAFAALDVELAP